MGSYLHQQLAACSRCSGNPIFTVNQQVAGHLGVCVCVCEEHHRMSDHSTAVVGAFSPAYGGAGH